MIPNELYHLQSGINSALDFAPKHRRTRPVIKFGLDEELDASKLDTFYLFFNFEFVFDLLEQLKKQHIIKSVTAAAKFAVNQLPEFVNECSVIHIPEMGHLVAIQEWAPGCDRHELNDYGFQFVVRKINCYN